MFFYFTSIFHHHIIYETNKQVSEKLQVRAVGPSLSFIVHAEKASIPS